MQLKITCFSELCNSYSGHIAYADVWVSRRKGNIDSFESVLHQQNTLKYIPPKLVIKATIREGNLIIMLMTQIQ